MRTLDTETLDGAAKHLAREWLSDDRRSPSGARFIGGPSYVLQEFNNFTFKDEHAHLLDAVKGRMGVASLAEFEKRYKDNVKPRTDDEHVKALREKLAIDPNGNHIAGVVGTTQIGRRIVGVKHRLIKTRKFGELLLPKHDTWAVFAGEEEERAAGNKKLKPLPAGAEPFGVTELQATNPNIAAVAALAGLDAIVDLLDGGSTAATIRGRSGSQPADPDASESGTLLFTLTMSDPAFGAAADITPGARATASSITDDSSADATGTLGYCRVGATGTGADDLVDGSVGTSSADFIFNTLSIVAGAVVSMSSFTITLPQGATAT